MSAAIVDALLASEEPSIRWKTRVHVLGESPTGRRAKALAREVRTSPRVQRLLSFEDQGRRLVERRVYRKWDGPHWVAATLADIGYPRGDRTLLPLRDTLMEQWLAPRYYDEFEVRKRSQVYRRGGVPVIGGRARRCASQQSNALWSVLVLGLADKRADDLVERLLHWQWPDGGWNCDKKPEACHSSFMESILPLRALSLFARETGSRAAARAARRAASRAAEIFLKRRLFLRERDGHVMRPAFTQLHYPLYWHYDVLHGLKVLAEAGLVRDPRCADALDLLESKRLPDGGWPAEGRFYKTTGPLGQQREIVDWGGVSKRRRNDWVTVDALYVLREAGRLEG